MNIEFQYWKREVANVRGCKTWVRTWTRKTREFFFKRFSTAHRTACGLFLSLSMATAVDILMSSPELLELLAMGCCVCCAEPETSNFTVAQPLANTTSTHTTRERFVFLYFSGKKCKHGSGCVPYLVPVYKRGF